jgi:hypothetical protein
MNLTYKLVSFLGSPFVSEDTSNGIKFSEEEKLELYKIAYNNKVGLFFLQRLKDVGELTPLEDKYALDKERYNETLITAMNLSSAISEYTSDFAIFKFFKPFPHTPSDVDALFFLSKEDYFKTVDYLLNNEYCKIGECPSQVVVYDSRGGYEQMDKRTVGGKKGGKYYIDLYNEVSASHVIYVDNETLIGHKIKVDCQCGAIQTLDPIADLVVVLTHSIIPEQLLTFADCYTTLYYIRKMDEKELNKLAQIFRENNTIKAGIASLSVIGTIHEKVYGFVPDKIGYLMGEMGWNPKIKGEIISDDFALPYRYSVSTLFKVLAERMKNKKGLKSILTQGVYMLNPKLFKWVVYNIIWRRKRETY